MIDSQEARWEDVFFLGWNEGEVAVFLPGIVRTRPGKFSENLKNNTIRSLRLAGQFASVEVGLRWREA